MNNHTYFQFFSCFFLKVWLATCIRFSLSFEKQFSFLCYCFSCECPPGFTGLNCSENVDDCKSHACLNGASCVDGLDSYTCMCSPGFSGRFCEIAPVLDLALLPNSYASTPACRLHQCQNNAVCYQPAGSLDYMCKCAPGTALTHVNKLTINIHIFKKFYFSKQETWKKEIFILFKSSITFKKAGRICTILQFN